MDNYGGYFSIVGITPVFDSPANTGNLRGGYLGGEITNALSIAEGAELLLPLGVIAPQPTTFQWTISGVVAPEQTLLFFRVPQASAVLHGAKIQAIASNAFGSLTSRARS